MTHSQGWKFTFIAGLFPITVGIYGYVTAFFMSTVLYPDEPFRVLWKTTSMSTSAVFEYNRELGVFLGISALCFWQLLIVFGATISSLAYFGLRQGQRWSWYFLAAILCWGAGNDTIAAIYLYQKGVMTIPTPLFVDFLGLTGLFFSRGIRVDPAVSKK